MKLSKTSLPHLFIVALVTLFAALAHAQNHPDWEESNVPLVGRVSHLEGVLRRLDDNQDDWVTTRRNSPIGAGDRLYTDVDTRVELILPNNTWIRMDSDTEMSLTGLDPDFTDLSLTLGKVRLYNKSSATDMKTSTPFGDIVAPAGSQVDIDLYSDGVEIISINRSVYFVHNRSNRRHEIRRAGGAIFADAHRVSASEPEVASKWNNWNEKMDALWAMRAQTHGESATYLPPALQYDAYALNTHGRWDRVYYRGGYYRFWRPIHVHVGWTPFSSGYWQVRWQDNVWIPHEPFGYVTHHYGNWIFTSGRWYWAPPVTRVMINAGLPLFRIGFAWYPGRVAWLHANTHVGWFPLGPYEPYYSHRRWGRRAHLVTKRGHWHHRRHHYRHRRHALVIHKDHLYRGRNYRDAGIRHAARSLKNSRFRTEPVLNRSTIKHHYHRPGIKRAERQTHVRKHPPRRAVEGRENRWANERKAWDQDKRTIIRVPKDPNGRGEQINPKEKPRKRDRVQTRRAQKRTRDIASPRRIRAERWQERKLGQPGAKRSNKKAIKRKKSSRASKSLKSERQMNKRRLAATRINREAVHLQKEKSSARQRPAIAPQKKTRQDRSNRVRNTKVSSNRSARQRDQGRSYTPKGQATQKFNANRTHRRLDGERPRGRSLR